MNPATRHLGPGDSLALPGPEPVSAVEVVLDWDRPARPTFSLLDTALDVVLGGPGPPSRLVPLTYAIVFDRAGSHLDTDPDASDGPPGSSATCKVVTPTRDGSNVLIEAGDRRAIDPRTCVIPGPHRRMRTPSWTGSGPGTTGDCLELAGTTPAPQRSKNCPLWC